MSSYKGFWSYVHADDKAEGGRITQLAYDLADQYELITGDSIELFLDRDSIDWGENWKQSIDSSLENVAFFIPIVTPRYFQSSECRHELNTFIAAAEKIDANIKKLILPLLYIAMPNFEEHELKDELVSLIKSLQWKNWEDIRFEETSSKTYRSEVANLANSLVEINSSLESFEETIPPTQQPAATLPTAIENQEKENEEPLGVIDKLALIEKEFPNINKTFNGLTQETNKINEIIVTGTEEITRSNSLKKGFSARILIAQSMAKKLDTPVDNILSHSSNLASQLHTIDIGTQAIIDQIAIEKKRGDISDEEIGSFLSSLRKFATSIEKISTSSIVLMESIQPIENMSRDLRPVFRRLRRGLAAIHESKTISDQWQALVDKTIAENITEERNDSLNS